MEKRSGRMTKFQKEYMINFLEGHTFLIEAKVNPCDLPKLKTCWEDLTKELNNMPGAKKNIKGWKDVST